MEKTIYDLKLHEILIIDEIDACVTRVASGWIYEFIEEEYDNNGDYSGLDRRLVFVPDAKY